MYFCIYIYRERERERERERWRGLGAPDVPKTPMRCWAGTGSLNKVSEQLDRPIERRNISEKKGGARQCAGVHGASRH